MAENPFTDTYYHYTVKSDVSYVTAFNFLNNYRYFIKAIKDSKFIVIMFSEYEDFLFYGTSHYDMNVFCGLNLGTYERLGVNKTIRICELCDSVEIYHKDIPKGMKMSSPLFDEHIHEPIMNWGKLCMHLSTHGLIQVRETDHEYRKNPYDIVSINGEIVNYPIEALNFDENGDDIRNKLLALIL